jgi:hypothetical protein
MKNLVWIAVAAALLVVAIVLLIVRPWESAAGGPKLSQAQFASELTAAGIEVQDPGKSYAMAGVYCQAWKDGQADAEQSAKQLARLALTLSETRHDNVDELVETYWSAVKRAC